MIGVIVNLFFTWWCWRLGSEHLEAGNNLIGWLGIAISAANFAAAMNLIF